MYFHNIHYCLKIMSCIGVDPEKARSKLQTVLFLFNVCLNLGVLYTVVLLPYAKEAVSLLDITDAIDSASIFFHGMIKLTALYLHRSNILDLLNGTKKFWKIEDVDNEEVKRSCFKILTIIKMVFHIYPCICTCVWILYSLRPVIVGGQTLLVDAYIPEKFSRWFMLICQEYALLFLVDAPCMCFDIFSMTMMILILVQFKLLNNEIRELFGNKEIMEDEELFKPRLKRWVDHHNYLIEFVRKFNEIISVTVLLFFGIIIAALCLQLYVLTKVRDIGNFCKHVSVAAIVIFEFTANCCIPGQLLTNEMEKLSGNIWSTQWYNSCFSAKFAMKLILMRSQQIVSITAGGLIDLNLQTILATFKTSYSYYTFLTTMDE